MSLSGIEPKEKLLKYLLIIPKSLMDYIDATRKRKGPKGQRRSKKDVIVSALELDRDLARELKPDIQALEAFAEREQLKLNRDLASILSRLVKRGLRALEVEAKSRTSKKPDTNESSEQK